MKHSSQWLQPLHALVNSTPRNQSLPWTTELTNCFIQSKTALSHAAQPAIPDITAATELVVDASGTHIGAVLQQVKDDSCAPLAFWSKALSPAQRAWSTCDRELFACFAAIRYFQYYLDAKDFILRSDHKPLVHKFHSSTLSASQRQQRYLDYLEQFTNKFEHVKGEHNMADAMSRPNNHIADLNNILPTTKDLDYLRLALAQRVDNETQQLRLQNSTSLCLLEVPLADHGTSLLCDDSQSRLQPIIPQSLRFAVFQQFHSLSHPGIETGVKLIGDRFEWTGMRKDIANFTKTCQQYANAKVLRRNTTPLSPVLPPSHRAFHSRICGHHRPSQRILRLSLPHGNN